MSTRTEYIDRLRKIADMLEATPELILPYVIRYDEIQYFPTGAAETAATARLLPTGWTKNDPNASAYDADYYKLTGQWEGITLTVLERRNAVCERVQVGTEKVFIPSVKASRATVEERPIWEFKCEPLLAKAVA